MPDLIAKPIVYNDGWTRLIFTVVGAHIVTEYGGNEPWLSRVMTTEYYIEFGSTFAITFLDTWLIYLVTRKLDRRLSWITHPIQRAVLQVLLGVIVPTLITFLLAAAYFKAYGMNILDTNYHLYALPFIASLIFIFNIYYLVYYLVVWAKAKPAEASAGIISEKPSKSLIIVHTPTGSQPFPVDNIAYFYRSSGKVFIRPFNGPDKVLDQSLDQIAETLDKEHFYRVARHMIVNHSSVKEYFQLNFGKVGLKLDPAFKEDVNVSKLQAKDFKQWLDR